MFLSRKYRSHMLAAQFLSHTIMLHLGSYGEFQMACSCQSTQLLSPGGIPNSSLIDVQVCTRSHPGQACCVLPVCDCSILSRKFLDMAGKCLAPSFNPQRCCGLVSVFQNRSEAEYAAAAIASSTVSALDDMICTPALLAAELASMGLPSTFAGKVSECIQTLSFKLGKGHSTVW